MKYAILIAGGFAFFGATASALDMDQFRAELADLDGDWTGVLEYRDYRSNERVQIPHDRTLNTAPDGSYQLTRMAFTDPGYQVYSAEIATFDGDTVSLAYAGNGEASVSQITLTAFEVTPTGWRAELTGNGIDAGALVEMRFVYELDGGALTADKSVRASDQEPFEFRNAIRVSRSN